MKTKRKSLGILLSLVLVISMLPTIPMTAFAAATVEVGTSWADLQTAITSAGTTETTIKLTADLTADATMICPLSSRQVKYLK